MKNGAESMRSVGRWSELAELAVRGLRATYASGLPHTMRWSDGRATPVGTNIRYALISLLGLAKCRELGLDVDDLIATFWLRLRTRRDEIAQSPGDVGLALWVQALTHQRGPFTAADALKVFRSKRAAADSVHLAWLMLGADHIDRDQSDGRAKELATLARAHLLRLYNTGSRLFHRHERSSLVSGVSRRVPCFANQIYPVMALAVHARTRGDNEAAAVGVTVADNLCSLQGELGQWWWLYDARDGGVVDGYPVFSVHQDGMAPMALMETTKAGGRSYAGEISRGLAWIDGANELGQSLVRNGDGLVLRDIHRRGVGRVARAIRSAAWCWGLPGAKRGSQAGTMEINLECRPYHLGWILYAASLACEGDGDSHDAMNARRVAPCH